MFPTVRLVDSRLTTHDSRLPERLFLDPEQAGGCGAVAAVPAEGEGDQALAQVAEQSFEAALLVEQALQGIGEELLLRAGALAEDEVRRADQATLGENGGA